MNALLKLRPGLFGLLFAVIAISSVTTAVTKAPRPTAATRQAGTIQTAALPSEQPEATPEQGEQPEQGQEYTYLQYQIDTDLVNLEQLVKNRAAQLLAMGLDEQDINNRLYDLGQVWAEEPSQLVERLALNRAAQTVVDGEPIPQAESLKASTVEGYRNVK